MTATLDWTLPADLTGDAVKWIWPALVETGQEPPALLGSRCTSCGLVQYPQNPDCPQERRPDITEQVALSGRGTVRSYTVVHRGMPGFRSPFCLATIELEEGPTCIAQLLDPADPDLAIGASVVFRLGVIKHDPDGTAVVGPLFAVDSTGGGTR